MPAALARRLAADTKAYPSDSCRQDLPPVGGHCGSNGIPLLWRTQENHAAPSARATYLCRRSAAALRNRDQAIDERSRDLGGVGLAQLPLFPEQPGRFGPVGPREGLMHAPGNL